MDGETRLPTIDELQVDDARLLVRCDLNVPLENGKVTDDLRIRASAPTLEKLLERGARVAVCSHLGRPRGKVVEDLRLGPVAERLADVLGRGVQAVDDITGDRAREACRSREPVVLLENLRFDPGEESNDPTFAEGLASLATAYVNDAFGATHRAHASIVGVPERLDDVAAGLLLVDEVRRLERLLRDPQHPYVAVLGGAKVSDKLGVIDQLIERVDSICIGGAMAFTLLAAKGKDVGRSRVERDRLAEVADVIERAQRQGIQLLLPTDVVVAEEPKEGSPCGTRGVDHIGDGIGVDIGPQTCEGFARVIEGARTVMWNGPMGIFEIDAFSTGTRAIVESIARATKAGAFTVAGGGDSAAALADLDMSDSVSHLSTGGGASLELLEGKELPGIAVLRRKAQA